MSGSELEPIPLAHDEAPARKPRGTRDKLMICPYCGTLQKAGPQCAACGGLSEPLSRKATQAAMGPWYIRDPRQPFRPGCSYPTLVQLIENGQVGPTTILRGPSTHQFWNVARRIPGVAHLVGYCHNCSGKVEPGISSCPHCQTKFHKDRRRDHLGLEFPHQRDADAAVRRVAHASRQARMTQSGSGLRLDEEPLDPGEASGTGIALAFEPGQGPASSVGEDLLHDVLQPEDDGPIGEPGADGLIALDLDPESELSQDLIPTGGPNTRPLPNRGMPIRAVVLIVLLNALGLTVIVLLLAIGG